MELLEVLGAKKVMLEVPYLNEIMMERTREDITAFLETRFGDLPRDLVEAIESVVDEKQLTDLVRSAAACRDLAEFRRAMTPG